MEKPCVPSETSVVSPIGREENTKREVRDMALKPLMEAPEFESQGYFQGEFKPFKLSDFKGKWVILCFYPADFTFV